MGGLEQHTLRRCQRLYLVNHACKAHPVEKQCSAVQSETFPLLARC